MIRRLLISLILCAPAALGALDAAAQEAPLWLRYPAISPDGETIVFAYQGDLYRVPSGGGVAVALTVFAGRDFLPVFSPDGRWIAFASDRYGNFDVFLTSISGGEARRLTFHSADDYPSDFTPDGAAVIFASARLDAAASAQFPTGVLPELYRVGVDGGGPEQVLTTPALGARYAGAGGRIVYHDVKSYENPWRKHHTSSHASDVWIYDPAAGRHRRLTTFAGEDRDPLVVGGDLYYLSEESGSFNVHRQPLAAAPGASVQVTRFERHPVRFLSASRGGVLCFGYDGEIYTLAPGSQPAKLAVEVLADRRHPRRELLEVTDGASEMDLAPSGKEIAFVARGEVFVASVESGTTRRVSDTPEQERTVSFSPDGRSLVYASERDGSWQIYRSALARAEEKYFWNATVLREEPVLASQAETFQPRYSPDGGEIAYLEARTTLRVLDLESGDSRTVLPGDKNFSYTDGDQYFDWSPDGRWFLVQFLKPGYWQPEAGLVAADGKGEVIDLTLSGYADFSPRWMMGGEMMIWFSDRDGLVSQARSGQREADVYAQFFTRKAYDRFRLSKEELELLEEQEKKDEKKEGKKEAAGGDDGEEEVAPLAIELAGIRDRRERLTIHSSRLADALVTPKGDKLLYLAQFEKGHDLWSTDLRTRETKVLAKLDARGGSLAIDDKGEHVFVLAGGTISKIEIESGKRQPVSFHGEMSVDRAAERAYFFEHAWRQVKQKFYDPQLHGVDWDFYKEAYARFLPHIDNSYDFAEMLSELLGELNASHTGAGVRRRVADADQTASLGLFFDASHGGPGLRIAEVMPKSPVIQDGSRIAAGVIVEKIDGRTIAAGANYFPLLNRKAGHKVLLGLYDEASGERWEEVVEPIDRRAESQLLYQRWVDGRRRATEELSAGRIGYVHVRSMSDRAFRAVYEEVMGRYPGAEALVVDTRFNGGGDLVDDLANFLSGESYMEFAARDGRVIGGEPGSRWTRPSIVLANEGNYSDAHCFPWAYQQLGIGKVVGMPVAGTCTFVWWETLPDGEIRFGVPMLAVASTGGTTLENLELEPDVRVENDYDVVAAGRDQQLERAVRELLATLEGG